MHGMFFALDNCHIAAKFKIMLSRVKYAVCTTRNNMIATKTHHLINLSFLEKCECQMFLPEIYTVDQN